MLPTLEKEKDNYDIPFRQCLIAAYLFHLILTAITIMQWVTNLPMGNFYIQMGIIPIIG